MRWATAIIIVLLQLQMSMNSSYKFIEFTSESKHDRKSVDFVSCSWISYDPSIGNLVTKFMPPPYDDENSALLHSLVKCRAPAPEDWPTYSIDIRGEAKTYQEALKKLYVLESKKYAYSTDSEQTAQDKALAAKREYQKTQRDDIEEEELWNVPSLEEYDSDYRSPGTSSGSDHEIVNEKSKSTQKKIKNNTEKGKNLPNSSKAKVNRTLPLESLSNNRSSSKASTPKCSVSISSPSICITPTTGTSKSNTSKHNVRSTTKSSILSSTDSSISSDFIRKPSTSRATSRNETTVLFDDVVNVISPHESFHEVGSSTDDIKSIINRGFRSQALQLTKISTQLEELQILLTEKNNENRSDILNTANLSEKYNLNLPFKILEKFQTFGDNLKTDRTLQEETKLNMWTSVNPKAPVVQSIRDIIKRYMSRDVIKKYTAVKETATKLVFQQTTFCSCMQDVIIAEFKKNLKASPVTDEKFYKGVGSVINSAKDWEGHRTYRTKKNPVEDPNVNEGPAADN